MLFKNAFVQFRNTNSIQICVTWKKLFTLCRTKGVHSENTHFIFFRSQFNLYVISWLKNERRWNVNAIFNFSFDRPRCHNIAQSKMHVGHIFDFFPFMKTGENARIWFCADFEDSSKGAAVLERSNMWSENSPILVYFF